MKEPYKISPHYAYSIALDMRGQRVLVVGGGQVALRKVKSLHAAGADVTVIAPDIHPEIINQGVASHKRPFCQDDLERLKPSLCMAATDDKGVNQDVAAACKARGILVNVCDDSSPSDFIVQAHFRRGDLLISASTNGKSPNFSRQMREYLEDVIDPGYGEALDLASQLREEILALPIPQEERAKRIRKIRIADLRRDLDHYSKQAVLERMRECLFSP